MRKKIHLPSPALTVALIALFVALSGTAFAAGVVPLAKRALLANNAKKLGGRTRGPASSVSALVGVTTAPWSLQAGQGGDFAVSCNAGEKAVSGGYDNPVGDAIALDTRPAPDGGGWKVYLGNLSNTAAASGTLYAVCVG